MYSPLQLKQYSLLELVLKEREASPNDVASNWIPGEPNVHVDFASASTNEYESRVILTVASKPTDSDDKTAAWDFSVRIAGYFEFTDRSVEIVRAKKLSLVNGASIVFGLARDILHATSLRGQKPSILLPSLNFQELADRFEGHEAPAKKPKKASVDTAVLEAHETQVRIASKAKPTTKGKSRK